MKRSILRLIKSTNVRFIAALVGALDRLAPRTAVRTALRMFTRPRRHSRPARERALLEGATPFTVGLGGSRIEAWSWGEGPTVLLVHGWEGRGTQLGAVVPPLVAAGFRVVAFDAPAHGDSPGRRTTLVGVARALERVLATTGPVHAVVAHSLGAAATTIALARGHQIGRVAYLAPMARVNAVLERFCGFLGLSAASAEAFRRGIESLTGVPIAALEGPSLASGLALPLLVVHDVDDREVPVGDALALAAAWRGARLRRVTGLGHRRILRDPGVVAEVVRFVAKSRPISLGFAEQLSQELERREERPAPARVLAARTA